VRSANFLRSSTRLICAVTLLSTPTRWFHESHERFDTFLGVRKQIVARGAMHLPDENDDGRPPEAKH